MYGLLIAVHFIACVALILIVLLQTGKGADMGAAFGGASQTLFGGTGGSTFLGKMTTGAAVIFMLTCLGLSYFSGATGTRSIMENAPVEQQQPKGPAVPEATPVQPVPAPQTPAPQQ